jgi:hypothetical protein
MHEQDSASEDAATSDMPSPTQAATIPSPVPIMLVSWSEYLLPSAYAAMEACCVAALLIGLASIHFFGLVQPLLPLWSPFLLLLSSSLLSQILKMQAFPQDVYAPQHHLRLNIGTLIALQTVLVMLVVWGSQYAGSYALWQLAWIFRCVNDLLAFHLNAFSILCIITIAYLLCYYGTRITHLAIDTGQTKHTLLTRSGVLLIVILLQAVNNNNDLELLLLIPLFLLCGLCTHALAHAIFLRYHHLTGLQNSRHTQDRLLLLTLFPISTLFLMLALAIGLIASPSLLTALLQSLSAVGIIYTWLSYLFAGIAVIILAPVFWLLQTMGFKTQLPKMPQYHPPLQAVSTATQPHTTTPPASVTTSATITGVILLVAILILAIFLTVVLLRRYKKAQLRIETENYENLWSWELFWSQVRSLCRNLWLSLFARRREQQTLDNTTTPKRGKAKGEIAHDVRSIYRAFLEWAAARNIWRSSDETPSEYKHRVDQQLALALIEPETKVVTEIYNTARYGQQPAREEEVAQMYASWQNLQHKVRTYDETSTPDHDEHGKA